MNTSRISAFEPISRQLQKINEYDNDNKSRSKLNVNTSSSSVSNDKVSILTLDEQIRQLEQTLVNSDDDDADDYDDDDDDDDDETISDNDNNANKIDNQDFIKVVNTSTNSQQSKHDKVNYFREKSYIEQRDEHGRLVKLVSKLDENDRIEPLPKSLLPSKKCNFVSLTGNYSSNYNNNNSSYNDYSKKRVRFDRSDNGDDKGDKSGAVIMNNYNDDNDNDKNNRTSQESLVKAKEMLEMEESIRIMLSQYQPVSAQEKVPFYCRICKMQSKDMESFIIHKQSDYHHLATKMERNLRYCKHCDKEFTSPDQLKGHMEGKAHKEQVHRLAARKRYNYHAE